MINKLKIFLAIIVLVGLNILNFIQFRPLFEDVVIFIVGPFLWYSNLTNFKNLPTLTKCLMTLFPIIIMLEGIIIDLGWYDTAPYIWGIVPIFLFFSSIILNSRCESNNKNILYVIALLIFGIIVIFVQELLTGTQIVYTTKYILKVLVYYQFVKLLKIRLNINLALIFVSLAIIVIATFSITQYNIEMKYVESAKQIESYIVSEKNYYKKLKNNVSDFEIEHDDFDINSHRIKKFARIQSKDVEYAYAEIIEIMKQKMFASQEQFEDILRAFINYESYLIHIVALVLVSALLESLFFIYFTNKNAIGNESK